ncbi:MAG: hypothetical protein JNL89_05390 [Rhodanobacteraceae bacterium]|nr:hypothetical protein [Rhodanobacteraceae bacterium]
MATSTLSIRLFGATSAVGRQLLPRLARAAAEVTASSRVAQASDAALHWLQEALPGAAAVDPATTHILSLGPLDLFVDWLAQQAPAGQLRQVIAFGSTSATTKSDSPAATERALARRLLDAEAALARESARLGIAWTLLRPTLIYGGSADLVARIARFSARWHVHPLPLGSFGRALRQPVHAGDLAAATFASIDNPAAFGRSFDLGGAEALSLAQLIARSARAQGNWSLTLPVPLSGLLRVAAVLGWLPARAALSPASLQRMAQDQVFDTGPARAALGYAPRPFQPGAA